MLALDLIALIFLFVIAVHKWPGAVECMIMNPYMYIPKAPTVS